MQLAIACGVPAASLLRCTCLLRCYALQTLRRGVTTLTRECSIRQGLQKRYLMLLCRRSAAVLDYWCNVLDVPLPLSGRRASTQFSSLFRQTEIGIHYSRLNI